MHSHVVILVAVVCYTAGLASAKRTYNVTQKHQQRRTYTEERARQSTQQFAKAVDVDRALRARMKEISEHGYLKITLNQYWRSFGLLLCFLFFYLAPLPRITMHKHYPNMYAPDVLCFHAFWFPRNRVTGREVSSFFVFHSSLHCTI